MVEIKKVNNDSMAVQCDDLLTKLIQSDRRFDSNTKETFEVQNNYKNKYGENNNALFLAYSDNVPVGYIFGYIKYEAGELVYNSVAYIDALYVLENYRNQGIATSLMNEFYNWCNDKKVKFISISVFKDNIDAYNLYRKQDFNVESYYMLKEL